MNAMNMNIHMNMPEDSGAHLTKSWQSHQCTVCHETVVVETLRSTGELLASANRSAYCPACGEANAFVVPGTVVHVHVAAPIRVPLREVVFPASRCA